MRRVVITGLGAISPHGIGAPAFWNALLEAKSSIATLTRFDPTGFDTHVAAVIPPYKTTEFVPKAYRKATKIMARDIELAVIAADFAVRDSHLITKGISDSTPPEKLAAETHPWTKPDPVRMGCNIGAGLICADLDELTEAMDTVRNPDNTLDLGRWGKSNDPAKTSGMENLTPLWLLKYLPNMLACHISIIHDTQGPSNAITCGQASAGLALAEAMRTIQRDKADLALVGGCESKVHPMGLMRWSLLQRLNTTSNDDPATACRPYDTSAAGGVIGEGGAILVIEEYEHAKRRGATLYAEIVGIGRTGSIGASVVEPDLSGEAPSVAIKKALKDANITPEQVDLIIPPGYSIPECDQSDARALKLAFGDALKDIPVLPVRGGIGDCGAGSQALDLVAGILAIQTQTIPPATNVKMPIEGLNIPQHKITKPLTYALVLATALGGHNCAIVLKKVSET